MEQLNFEQLKETVYHDKLENGLEVFVLPKEDFHKTFVTFTTKYGSVDNTFVPLNGEEAIQVPDGIAHFLEHKMFEKEDGDVFQQFSKQGAAANAFTSFTRTAYLFSATANVKKNLETLVNFVQAPYFTEETVEKEKGIIGQEIRMYDDNPDWRLFFGLIDNMYHHHPVKIDIAGTEESIADITEDLLYTCYETFYHPSNMLLFVTGPVDPEEILSFVSENQNQKDFKDQPPVERFNEKEPKEVARVKKVLRMPVQTSKCIIGFKEKSPGRSGAEMLRYELAVNLVLDLMFGSSTENYEALYDEGLIDDSFSFDYTEEDHFGFSMIGGDTNDPDALEKKLFSMIEEFKSQPLDNQAIERVRKKKIGSFLQALNVPEFIANQFTRYEFSGMNLFEVVPMLESLTADDLQKVLEDHFDESCFTVCQVRPSKEG
ncbi:MAG TPA: pitrilysin family protein [Bacillales bacterium]|nr:pitrilysin family protein [Bacillales bacterium]